MINTVYELITDVMAKQYPDRVAFRYVAADGKTVVEKTYAQYVQDIRRAVTYFKENIPDIKGKRVGIMSRNCYEYGVNSFGAILAGAVVVTINQKKTWEELEYELGLAEPSLIVNDGIDYGCRPDIEAAYGDKLRPMEGFKDSGWPKIEVVRKEISDTPVSFQPLAVVGDIPGADFGLEDAQALADWLVAQMPGL